jgi:tetratricopeptide (TPR) repeat protein
MKAKNHEFVGRLIPHSVAAGILISMTALPQETMAQDSGAAFRKGINAETRLDLFGARDHFREAIRINPGNLGWKEHTAWFLYINGFQDRECLALFEEVKSHAADRRAVQRAIYHLQEKLGQSPPAARPPVPRPRGVSPSAPLPQRLKYARELYWSGAPQKSQTSILELIAVKPEEPALRWELAKVLVALGDYDGAVAELVTARNYRPNEPELVLDHAIAEALRGRRRVAVGILKQASFPDIGAVHLARARAHHYVGEFPAAAREYERAIATRPHDELAAHGLAEARLRNYDIGGARDLLSTWPQIARQTDWADRIALERDLASTRLRAGIGYYENSLDYERWDIGVDLRFRPIDELECTFATTHAWFEQKGFSSIDRQTAQIAMRYQPNSFWALFGNAGVNDYSNGWTSLVGGVGVMLRPTSTLELSLSVEHTDMVDSEPPLGMSIYSMGTTIGAAGGRATMDAITLNAVWTPIENLDLFGRYRIADLSGGNRLNEIFLSTAYTFSRVPFFRIGYAIGFMDVDDPSPVYTDGAATTSYYYDPDNQVTHHLYLEHVAKVGQHVTYGVDARIFLNQDGGTGAGAGTFIQYRWSDHQAIRLDARYFTQDRSRDRNNTRTGNYQAFNLNAVYEYRF